MQGIVTNRVVSRVSVASANSKSTERNKIKSGFTDAVCTYAHRREGIIKTCPVADCGLVTSLLATI